MSAQAGALQAVHRRVQCDHDSVLATKALLTEVVVHVAIHSMSPTEQAGFEERQRRAREALDGAEKQLAFALLMVSRLREVVP